MENVYAADLLESYKDYKKSDKDYKKCGYILYSISKKMLIVKVV